MLESALGDSLLSVPCPRCVVLGCSGALVGGVGCCALRVACRAWRVARRRVARCALLRRWVRVARCAWRSWRVSHPPGVCACVGVKTHIAGPPTREPASGKLGLRRSALRGTTCSGSSLFLVYSHRSASRAHNAACIGHSQDQDQTSLVSMRHMAIIPNLLDCPSSLSHITQLHQQRLRHAY